MKTHRVEIFRASMSVFPGGRGCAVLREQATQRTKRHVKLGGSQMSERGSDHHLFFWVPDRKVEFLSCPLSYISSTSLSKLVYPSVRVGRTCAVAIDGLQVREVLDVRRGAGHRQQSR